MLNQAKNYYKACIDTDKKNKLGLTPLQNLINKYGGWNIDDNFIVDTKMWELFHEFNWKLGMETILKIDFQNVTNSPALRISTGIPISQFPSLYSKKSIEQYKIYSSYLHDLIELLGGDYLDFERIYNLDHRIANVFTYNILDDMW
ncbi:unnamed protein product [Gordionus sp. m RMFG-2023]